MSTTARTSVTITVPGSPDRILAPNRRAHGRAKAEATAQHRHDARYAALDQLAATVPYDPLFAGPVSVLALVRWAKGERSKDLDSCAVCVKPYIDGLVDARLMSNDSQMKILTVQQERDGTGRGEVVLTVTTIEREELTA